MTEPRLSRAEREAFARRMRMPVLSVLALMVLLGMNVLLGATLPFRSVWIVEALVLLAMVLVVLGFSMEVVREPPLVRLFAGLGFCWVAILFAMTMIDYLTR